MFENIKNNIDFWIRSNTKFSRKNFVETDEKILYRNYLENLYTFDILEQCFVKKAYSNPKILDIGSKNWFYAKGEYSFFDSFCSGFSLDGVEIDAYRLYSNFYSRYETAKFYTRGLKNTRYIASNLLNIKDRYDFIVWFLPFVLKEPHIKWGLPMACFMPQELLEHAMSLLNLNGQMLIINQGESEAAAQKKLLDSLKIKYEEKGIVKSDFLQYKNDRYAFLTNELNFELNLSHDELVKRTSKDCLIPKEMLKEDAKEYEALADGDKKALVHLVKAAKAIDEVFMKQDNPKNLAFKAYLEREVNNGNEDAKMTLALFNAQIGMNAVDSEANKIFLAKGENELPGKGFYPADLTKEEFHTILLKMIKDGEIQEVKNILNQRSMVVRDGQKLKGIDYTEYFAKEFSYIADELEAAAEVSTNEDFNKYLKLQAIALCENNPKNDAYADKKWAELQDTPLEFTISREQYADEMTGTVVENEELNKLLEENGIEPISKDSIGIRVGIVNKEGTAKLLEIKKYMPVLAQHMPYKDEYEQNIGHGDDEKQTMVDVDIVTLRGDEGTYRGGITLAQNLPNNDKPSLKIGGGRRNV